MRLGIPKLSLAQLRLRRQAPTIQSPNTVYSGVLKTREISFDPAQRRMNDTIPRLFRGWVARLVRPRLPRRRFGRLGWPQPHPRGPRPRHGPHSLSVGPSIATVTLNPAEATPCRPRDGRLPAAWSAWWPPHTSVLAPPRNHRRRATGGNGDNEKGIADADGGPLVGDGATAALRHCGAGAWGRRYGILLQGCFSSPI